MNFSEVVAEVLRITKRPDKTLDIRREVNAALLKYCTDYEYPRNLVELLLPIDPAEYAQAIPLTSLPYYRSMKYIRRSGTRFYLSALPLSEMTKPNCNYADKFYIAGDSLNINMTALAANLDIGYNRFPPTLTDSSPEHWMLEGNWFAIMSHAAAKVFADIGDEQSHSTHLSHAREAYAVYRSSAVRSEE